MLRSACRALEVSHFFYGCRYDAAAFDRVQLHVTVVAAPFTRGVPAFLARLAIRTAAWWRQAIPAFWRVSIICLSHIH